MNDRCSDCPGNMFCVRVDDLRRTNRIGAWYAILFVLVIGAVSVVERSVTVRPADVLERLHESEQNVSEQIDSLKVLLSDYEKTNRPKHPRTDDAAEHDAGGAGTNQRAE